jgi:hypothetical protein
MWVAPAAEVAASNHRVVARYPDRFLLGVGVGHPEVTADAVIAHGIPDHLVSRLNAHLDAGADHVSAYILTASGDVDDEYPKLYAP